MAIRLWQLGKSVVYGLKEFIEDWLLYSDEKVLGKEIEARCCLLLMGDGSAESVRRELVALIQQITRTGNKTVKNVEKVHSYIMKNGAYEVIALWKHIRYIIYMYIEPYKESLAMVIEEDMDMIEDDMDMIEDDMDMIEEDMDMSEDEPDALEYESDMFDDEIRSFKNDLVIRRSLLIFDGDIAAHIEKLYHNYPFSRVLNRAKREINVEMLKRVLALPCADVALMEEYRLLKSGGNNGDLRKLLSTVTITQEQFEENLQCSFCFEEYRAGEVVTQLSCSHLYHTNCIKLWIPVESTCPYCRRKVEIDSPLEYFLYNHYTIRRFLM